MIGSRCSVMPNATILHIVQFSMGGIRNGS